MTDLISKLFERVNAGEIPTERNTVEECIVQVFFGLLNLWSTNGKDGGPQLAGEIDYLITALKNKNDPIVKTLNIMDRTMMFAAINTLTKGKENVINAYAKAETEAEGTGNPTGSNQA